MSRRALAALGAGLAITIATTLTACGSTGNVASTDGASAIGFGNQICSQATAAKPGYQNTIPPLSGGTKTLSGAGSTFVAPVMSVWAKDYATATGVQVAYQSIGSGGGIAQIQAQTVDFGASDAAMADADLAAAKGGPILHIPMELGAVVPAYNLKGVGSGLKFDGETLGKIFAGEITKWNDPALKALNPGVNLPNEAIAVAYRSDASGTTAIWTDFLTKESPSWVTKLGQGTSAGKTVAWPVGIGGKGNEGVSGVISQTAGGLGYVELAYAAAQEMTFGSVKNKAGNFIEACPATISKDVNGTTFPPDLRTTLTDGPDANAYPISGTTFALVYQNQTNPAKAAALINFLAWVLTSGQDESASVTYAPLGADLQKLAVGQLTKITINGKPAISQ